MHIPMPWLPVAWWPWRSSVVVVHYHGIIVRSLLGMCNLVAQWGWVDGDGLYFLSWIYGWLWKGTWWKTHTRWRCRWPHLSFLPRSKISHISARSRLSALEIAFMNHYGRLFFKSSNIFSLLHSDHLLIHIFASNKKCISDQSQMTLKLT